MTGCPKHFAERCGDRSDLVLGKAYGVTPATIRNWKKAAGVHIAPHPRTDYTQVDIMLKRCTKPTDIAAATGVSVSAIKVRRKKLFTPEPKPDAPKGSYSNRMLDFLNPEVREKVAYERMAKKMEMPLDHFMEKWLPHNKAWQRDMGFL